MPVASEIVPRRDAHEAVNDSSSRTTLYAVDQPPRHPSCLLAPNSMSIDSKRLCLITEV